MAIRERQLRQSDGPNRVPPHNLEAEESVLGACMLSREAIASALEILSPEDFYKPAHAEIFNAILQLYGKGEPVDAITLSEELQRRGTIEQIGGKPYVHTLLQAVPTPGSAAHYARIVEEHALLRRLISASHEISDIAFSVPEDVEETIDQAEDLVYQVSRRRISTDFVALKDLLTDNMEMVEKLYERGSNITGLPTGFTELDDITAGLQDSNLIIIAARPAMGKCLSDSTLIDLPETGERISIQEFVRRRVGHVSGLDELGRLRPTGVTDWIDNGERPCFAVSTRTGRRIEVTSNHPFLTALGWRELTDLAIGARIAVPRKLGTFGSEHWEPSLARLLGYLIAEGGLTRSSPVFTNTDPEIIEDLTAGLAEHFPECTPRPTGKYGYRLARPRSCAKGPNPLSVWLQKLGLHGKKSDVKDFPEVVWRFDKRTLAELLRALFSCDGTIYPMWGYPRIEFCVASENLAKDVHHALVRFGIVARIRKKTARAWNITITEPQSVVTFQSEIGWIGAKTRRFPENLVIRRSNLNHAPQETWTLIREAAKSMELSLSALARKGGVDVIAGNAGWNPHTKQGIGPARLRAYADVLNDPRIERVASPDLYWDEIVSIEPIGLRRVFDLTVPDGSNFVGADICVHNSSLALTIAQHLAVNEQVPCVLFSLEMSKMELVQRMMCAEARVDSNRLRRGNLKDSDWPALSHALGRLAEAPVFIDDTPNVTVMEMRAKCRRLKSKHGLGLVIIDYLQLMQSLKRSENRVQEVSEISRSLKILARELDIPVIAVSQLSRNVEYRSDKRPLLADLRESGSIEQDSDLVIFIYRDEVYNPDTPQKGIAEIHIAKHRNGPIGKIELAFLDHYTKFANLARGV